MRLYRASSVLLLTLAASSLLCAAPGDPPPKKGGLVFPEVTPSDTSPPAPKPAPGTLAKLTGDMLYVVPSESPFLLFAAPMDKVTITRESGPIRIRGKFLDGTGKVETRTYSAKHVAIIEAAGTGRVELIAVPGGAVDEKEAVRLSIDVEAGQGAQPPPDDGKKDIIPAPKPKPPPIEPEPKPEPKVVVGPLWIVTVAESSERNPDFAKLVNDTAYWKSLNVQGHKTRHYDKDDENAIRGGYVKHASKVGLPAIVFVDEDGDLVKVVKAPKTTAEVSAILKEIGAK